MGKQAALIIILLVILLGGGLFFYTRMQQNASQQQSASISETNPGANRPSNEAKASNSPTVVLDDVGFSPKTLTISKGTTVVWTNKSGGPASIDSDPHPIHTSYPPLNLGNVDDGQTVELQFDQPGTYNYHDHYHPQKTGTVIVN